MARIKTRNETHPSNPGFTIVELLVVIVVIGVLAAITIVSYTGISARATQSTLMSDLTNAVRRIKLYQVDNIALPGSVTDCPTPAAGNICLKLSPGNTVTTYTKISANEFVLDATSGNGTIYRITEDTAPVAATGLAAIAAISGTRAVGSVLTAGAVTPSGATVTYQWQTSTSSSGTYTNISGATASTYTLVASDLGDYIKVVATGSGSYANSVTSAATTVITTPITAIAVISGTKAVGSVLTAGAITPAGATVGYQWQSSTTSGGTYTNISGATSSAYTLVAGDLGKYIKVVATGSGNYTGSVASAETTVITTPLTAIGAITGTPKVGTVLTKGALTPAAGTGTYQWQSATTSTGTYTNIAGATAATYTPVVGDVGKFLKVVVTGNGSYTGTVTSAATAVAVAA